jgi:inosine/xanthosine triphosphatase
MIVLGTASKDKLKILEDYLASHDKTFKIVQVQADSGVSDQPISEEETIKGAKTRAKNAYKSGKYELAIGLEGGLVKHNKLYHLICIACIYNGKKYFLGISKSLPLPQKVSSAIEDGVEFGEQIRIYANSLENMHDQIHEIISRKKSFTSAINVAFSKLQNYE